MIQGKGYTPSKAIEIYCSWCIKECFDNFAKMVDTLEKPVIYGCSNKECPLFPFRYGNKPKPKN